MKTIFRDVDTASQMMRRYYRTTKETMRSMAGYLPKMQSWPAKKLLAKHIWLDSLHADMLRSRALDLRYPRVDVDEDSDSHLTELLHWLPNAESDAGFLTAIYHVIKPNLINSLKTYLTESDTLDDAPSHLYMKRIINEMENQLQEFEVIWLSSFDQSSKSMSVQNYRELVAVILNACGGIEGPDLKPEDYSFIQLQPEYQLPMEGGREASWSKAVMQVSPRPPATVLEHRVLVAIDHANEVWASETAAGLIWAYKEMPWDLYFKAARWCYDEMRHAMMGEQRLTAWGFEIGIDYPMVPDHWRVYRKKGLGTLLLLLHGLEQKGPLHKSKLKKELWSVQDYESAQDCDYDWADESGHISFGLAWIKVIFRDWKKGMIIQETDEVVEDWKKWIEQRHKDGTHGYEVFLQRMDAKMERIQTINSDPLKFSPPTHL